jgi:hypothetical protein
MTEIGSPSKLPRPKASSLTKAAVLSSVLVAAIIGATLYHTALTPAPSLEFLSTRREPPEAASLKVFLSPIKNSSGKKLMNELQNSPLVDSVQVLTANDASLVKQWCPASEPRFLEFKEQKLPHLALELVKYCALLENGGLFLDSESPLISSVDDAVTNKAANIALLNDEYVSRAIHGALLLLNTGEIAQEMVKVLTSTNIQILQSSPLLLGRTLYDAITAQASVESLTPGLVGDQWFFYQHKCTIHPLGGRQATAPISSYALNSYR